MKEHLLNILELLSNLSSHSDIKYNEECINNLTKILKRFCKKLDKLGFLDSTDFSDYDTANDIIYNLNLDNNQVFFTDSISNEFYAFGFEFQEFLKNNN